MGGKSTKQQVGNNRKDTLFEKPNTIIDKSSGFHIVELHMPTVTSGSAVLLVLVVIIVIAIILYRQCQRSGSQQQSGRLPQYSPTQRHYEEQQAMELQQFWLRHLLSQVQTSTFPQLQVSTVPSQPTLSYASVPSVQSRDTTLMQTC